MLQLIDLFETTLSGAYTAGGASLALTSTAGLPASGDYWLSVYDGANAASTYEVFKVTGAPSGGAVPVTGAQAGTTAKNHAAGQIAYASVLTAAALAQLKADAVVGLVPDTRSILSGTGLTGGGNLTANRTLSVVDDTSTQRIRINSGGTLTGTRPALNLIQGANVTLSVADDAANNRVNVTVAAAAGGSQTPWTSNINAAGYSLSSVSAIGIGAMAGGAAINVVTAGDRIPGMMHYDSNPLGTPGLIVKNDSTWAAGLILGGSNTSAVPLRNVLAFYTQQGSNLPIAFSPNEVERMRISAAGNVGIGTTAPRSQLSIVPAGTPTSVATATQVTICEGTNAAGYQLQLGYFSDAGVYKSVVQALSGSSGAHILLNPSGGSVVIGGLASKGQLTIVPSVNGTSVPTANQICIGDKDNTSGYQLQLGYFVYASTIWTGCVQAVAGGGNTPLVLNPNGGNVAVGKANPSYALDITGDCNVSGAFRVNGVAIGGSQTPWTQNIDGGAFSVSNVAKYSGPSSVTGTPAFLAATENFGAVPTAQPNQTVSFNYNTAGNTIDIVVKMSNGTKWYYRAALSSSS